MFVLWWECGEDFYSIFFGSTYPFSLNLWSYRFLRKCISWFGQPQKDEDRTGKLPPSLFTTFITMCGFACEVYFAQGNSKQTLEVAELLERQLANFPQDTEGRRMLIDMRCGTTPSLSTLCSIFFPLSTFFTNIYYLLLQINIFQLQVWAPFVFAKRVRQFNLLAEAINDGKKWSAFSTLVWNEEKLPLSAPRTPTPVRAYHLEQSKTI